MIPYGRQSINSEDIKAVSDTLGSDWLTTGPKVKEFEAAFAEKVGSKYAVAASSGTAALHLACLAVGLKKGDKLITTPMTFCASANCALYCDAEPVFADIKADGSGLIDAAEIAKKIDAKTKVIIPVHYAGQPCDMEEIKEVARKNDLAVIEDACHAIGSTYKGSRVGDCKYSDMCVFSFHPVKHITTGEGGMITTNSKEMYEKMCMLRNHGLSRDPADNVGESAVKTDVPWYYVMHDLGFNYRLTDFQCALGLSQLKRIDDFVKKRLVIAGRYDSAFEKDPCVTPLKRLDDRQSSYHLYVVQAGGEEDREKLFRHLKEKGISCQVHYLPVYLHPYYLSLGYKEGSCPNAEEFYKRIISIPIFPGLDEPDQDSVIMAIRECLEGSE
jgi:UDP-4-amino-4,6-dideoxy-N-acetyl-beta-L-altrosamine transaminase